MKPHSLSSSWKCLYDHTKLSAYLKVQLAVRADFYVNVVKRQKLKPNVARSSFLLRQSYCVLTYNKIISNCGWRTLSACLYVGDSNHLLDINFLSSCANPYEKRHR